MVASARYLIYDYAYQRVVSCGVARGRAPFENGRVRRIDWDAALADLGRRIATPF